MNVLNATDIYALHGGFMPWRFYSDKRKGLSISFRSQMGVGSTG